MSNSLIGRWASLGASALIAVGLGLFGLALLRAAFEGPPAGGPYRIVDVLSDPSLARHAVIYRVSSDDAAAALTGVWISDGGAPDKGEAERPRGHPVAVWSEGAVRIGWQNGRLRLVGDQRRVLTDPSRLGSCLAEGAKPVRAADWQLCLDPEHVTFVPIPR